MDHILSFLAAYGQKILFWAAGFLAVMPTIIYGWYRWKTANFMHKIQFSFNYMDENGHWAFATIMDEELVELFGPYERLRLTRLAKQQTAFLRFASKDEAWAFLNVLLNAFSAKFGAGVLAFAADPSRRTPVELVFGITCERDKGIRTRKFRVMLATDKFLSHVSTHEPNYASPRQNDLRGKTMQEMLQMIVDGTDDLLRVKIYV